MVGDGLRSRIPERRVTEISVAVHVLNTPNYEIACTPFHAIVETFHLTPAAVVF
jgi:hypothetical protein